MALIVPIDSVAKKSLQTGSTYKIRDVITISA